MGFASIKLAVRLAEYVVVAQAPLRKKDDALRALTEEALVGPWLVMTGVTIIWKRIAWGFLIAALLTILMGIFERSYSGSMWLATLTFGMGCVYFGLPSRTVLAGVSEQSIDKLQSEVRHHVTDLAGLDRLSSGVQIVKSQAMERLGRINVLIGVAWGALFWFVSSHVLSPAASAENVEMGAWWALVLGIMFALLMVSAVSYSAAVRTVFHTLDFALIEVRRELSERRGPS